MEQTKLEKLLITEVSGVDDPANQLPGWMVTKSADGQEVAVDPLLIVAEEMEAVTKASDSKKPYGDVVYADPGYQKDGKKRYPLDTETHIRAAWSYINQGDNASVYSSDQLTSIKAKIKAAMKKLGATVDEGTSKSDSGVLTKLKGILQTGAPGKDIDMDRAELETILDERDESLVAKVAEAVAKSAAPAEGADGEAKPEVAAVVEATPTLTEDDVTKQITAAIEEQVVKTYNDIFEKVLDRIEGIEKALGIVAKSSIDGQEGGSTTEENVEKSTPKLADAIAAAFKR